MSEQDKERHRTHLSFIKDVNLILIRKSGYVRERNPKKESRSTKETKKPCENMNIFRSFLRAFSHFVSPFISKLKDFALKHLT